MNKNLRKIIDIWWASLSINEMKKLRDKHLPTWVWNHPMSNKTRLPLYGLSDIEQKFSLKLEIFEKEFAK